MENKKIYTYKQLIRFFELIADKHKLIKDCKVCRDWELGANQTLFPLLQVTPYTASLKKTVVNNDYNMMEYSLKLRILDKLQKGNENRDDVYSDTLQLITDVITTFNTHPFFRNNNVKIVSDADFSSEEEKTTFRAAGWSTVIRIRVINYIGYCGVPIESITDEDLFNI